METKLTHSDRKFIRLQKASIRARVLDTKKQEELITQLYKKFSPDPIIKPAKEEKAEEVKVQKVEKREAKNVKPEKTIKKTK